MTVKSYHADGSLLAEHDCVSREPYGPEGQPDAWHINLANGKRITSTEAHFDKHYPGWRELPEQSHQWRSMVSKGGKRYEKDHRSQVEAECWIAANLKTRHVKAATILRAETVGINAGKFFLHRILK